VKFYSSRPESFAIYKRTNESSDWEPYQFYSASCEQTYGKITNEIVQKNENEARALCSDEFSDIAPLSGGSVAFSTLENRPSAYDFQTSKEMSDWVTATDIRLSLDRLNTFGDDIFGDPKVLRSYFYAISDISIGGRCKCHGHADKCVEFEDQNFETRLKCECVHNTAGVDCDTCAPFYNDSPWAPAPYGQFVDVCRRKYFSYAAGAEFQSV
jgi:laminin gamma 1